MKNRIRPHILVLVSIDFYCDSLLFSPVVTIGEPAVVCALKTIRMAAIFREPIQDLVQEQESSCKTVPGADHSSNQSLTCSHPESSQGTRNFGQFSILHLHIPVCQFARHACLYRQSAQGGSWSDSMLHLFEQNNLYLSSLMLFVPGRELYIRQVKF